MEIHQVLVSAAPGDAITLAALELQPILGRGGFSGLYARYIHPDLEDRFEFLEALDERSALEDIIVYHASIGEAPVSEFLQAMDQRLVVDYHNISPAAPFLPYDQGFAARLENGRKEIAALADRAVLALADSAFNAAELVDMGYRDVRVAPLVLDAGRLIGQPVPARIRRDVESLTDGPVVLFVGQLMPHKRVDFLLHTFHVLSTYLDTRAALVVVGAPRIPRYALALGALVSELNLRRVLMSGAVSDAELAAWYHRADVFMTASEHEGYCAPLLEAMAFDVPVVARDFAAVPETLGSAGLLLSPDDSAVTAAEGVARVLGDDSLRRDLVRRGKERLQSFEPVSTRSAFLDQVMTAAAR